MSAIINNSYLDFFAIAIDAYNSKSNTIYRKLMMTIIATYKSLINEMQLASNQLDRCNSLRFSQSELEDFYDEMYASIDIIKLYKSQLEHLKTEDMLFTDFYEVVDKLHLVMVEHLDRVSTLEAKAIQQKENQVA